MHQRAVGSGERHDVRDGPQRHQIELLAQVGLGLPLEPARLPQPPAQRQQQVERHSHRGQLATRKRASWLVRIQDGNCPRQALGRLRRRVVVDHHHVEPEPRRRIDLRHRGHAAIGADDQPGAAVRQPAHRLMVQAVPFDHPVGHVELDGGRRRGPRRAGGELAQHGDQERRAGDAIDVVVAVHADRLARLERALHPRNRRIDALEPERIGEVIEPRLEEALGRRRIAHAARPERTADGRQEPQLGRQPAALLRSGGRRRLPR